MPMCEPRSLLSALTLLAACRSSRCGTIRSCTRAICCFVSTMRHFASRLRSKPRSSRARDFRSNQRRSELVSAQDTLAFQKREYERQQRLLAAGIASQSQVDRALHALDDARSQVAGAQQQVSAVVASLGGNPNIDPDQHPTVQQAQALLDRATLNLSYTVVTAPSDGIVTRVEQLQVGSYINASAPLFALVSTGDIWIEANFKEDQLTHMRAGQIARIKVDSYPGKIFEGRVASVSPGTGSQFSELPPENATGNWVKVVQRLPVRVELDHLDPSFPLHDGLSANVSVDTHYQRLFSGVAEANLVNTSAAAK